MNILLSRAILRDLVKGGSCVSWLTKVLFLLVMFTNRKEGAI